MVQDGIPDIRSYFERGLKLFLFRNSQLKNLMSSDLGIVKHTLELFSGFLKSEKCSSVVFETNILGSLLFSISAN